MEETVEPNLAAPQVESPDSPERTVTLKRSHIVAMFIPLAFLLGLGAGYLFWGREAAQAGSAADAAAQGQEAPPQVTRYDVPVDDDPVLGPQDAAITIIEFSDYECPFCTRWQEEVLPRIQETYPNQVRLVFRDYPLYSIHPNAQSAAEAAHCAGEQDAYWDYHDQLFDSRYGLGNEAYVKYAGELGLDQPAFEECLSSRRYQDEVAADYDFAFNLGVRSTPTFFINGIALVGAQPFEVFKDVIDKELAGEIPK